MNLLVICLTLAFYAQALWAKFYPTANEDEFDKQQQQTNGECVYKTNMGLIIKTNESIADKAVFLRFEKDQTRESCLQNCCSLTNCNLAVYESKEHHTCYLFDCGREEVSRCHFSQHDDYMSMTVNHQPVTHKPPLKDTQDKHENELAGLVENQTPPPRKTTTKSTTSLNLSSPTQPVQKSGEVYGECSEGLYCQDVNAECQDGVCLCTHGYDFKHKACISMAEPKSYESVKTQSGGRDGRPLLKIDNSPKQTFVESEEPIELSEDVQEKEGVISPAKPDPVEDWHRKTSDTDQSSDLGRMALQSSLPSKQPVPQINNVRPVKSDEKLGQTEDTIQEKALKEQQDPTYVHPIPANVKEPEIPVEESHDLPIPKMKPKTQLVVPVEAESKDDYPIHDSQDWKENVGNVPRIEKPPVRPPPTYNSKNYPNRNLGRPRVYPQRPGSLRSKGGRPAPHTHYQYPYNPERGPIPQYPVQYPSYEWDYHPEEYGASFPDRDEDYRNPETVEQGVYDYPYHHPYFGSEELNGKGIPKVGNRPKAPYPQHVPKKGSLNHGKSHFEDGPPIESPRQHVPDNRVIADIGPITPSPSPSTTTTSTTITTTTARETTTGNLDTTPSTSSNTSVKTPTQPAVAKGREVDVEQIIIASPTDSAQGPIVALALGLAFTVMLLLFVGCRLRTVKRRIRKGRPLHSNEADYLINGMYL